MKLTWYGHSAFRIEAGAAKILIDPSCHVPARQSDWIYTRGYPVLTR